MATSLSRRSLLAFGAAGAAVPLLGQRAASATPDDPPTTLDDIYDVRSFGAKGDGTTIDTPAINRAIAAAATDPPGPHGGPGGTVYFPAGTYACYSIHLQSNVALYLARVPRSSARHRPRRRATTRLSSEPTTRTRTSVTVIGTTA